MLLTPHHAQLKSQYVTLSNIWLKPSVTPTIDACSVAWDCRGVVRVLKPCWNVPWKSCFACIFSEINHGVRAPCSMCRHQNKRQRPPIVFQDDNRLGPTSTIVHRSEVPVCPVRPTPERA